MPGSGGGNGETMLDDVGQVDVDTDTAGSIWTTCRLCHDVITEVWGPKDAGPGHADLTLLVQDALDHVCGFGYATD